MANTAETLRSFMGIEIVEDVQNKCPSPIVTAKDVSLPAEFAKMMEIAKIASPSPVQCQFWPAALAGLDIIAIAATGSGKTLAYLLPAVHHILNVKATKPTQMTPAALVVVPTRELAQQVALMAKPLRKVCDVRALAVYGGVEEAKHDAKLRSGKYMLVVGTPGRLCALIGSMLKVSFVVLDECDQLLNLGFTEDLNTLCQWVNPERQTLLLSATFQEDLRAQASGWMKGAACVRFKVAASLAVDTKAEVPTTTKKKVSSQQTIPSSILQEVRVVDTKLKPKLLLEFLQQLYAKERKKGQRQLSRVLVFVNTMAQVKWLAGFLKQTQEQQQEKLQKNGIPLFKIGTIFGKLSQEERDTSLQCFKNGSIPVLLATDLASRGLDIKSLPWVINYDFPKDFGLYAHRVGRTGRADRTGSALTFLTSERDRAAAPLIRILRRSKQVVPSELSDLAKWSKEKQIQEAAAKGEIFVPEESEEEGETRTASTNAATEKDDSSESEDLQDEFEGLITEKQRAAEREEEKEGSPNQEEEAEEEGDAEDEEELSGEEGDDEEYDSEEEGYEEEGDDQEDEEEEEAPILQTRNKHVGVVSFDSDAEEEGPSGGRENSEGEDEDRDEEDERPKRKRKKEAESLWGDDVPNRKSRHADLWETEDTNAQKGGRRKKRRGDDDGENLWSETAQQFKDRTGGGSKRKKSQSERDAQREARTAPGAKPKAKEFQGSNKFKGGQRGGSNFDRKESQMPSEGPKWKEWKAERRANRGKDDGPKLTRKDRKMQRFSGIKPPLEKTVGKKDFSSRGGRGGSTRGGKKDFASGGGRSGGKDSGRKGSTRGGKSVRGRGGSARGRGGSASFSRGGKSDAATSSRSNGDWSKRFEGSRGAQRGAQRDAKGSGRKQSSSKRGKRGR